MCKGELDMKEDAFNQLFDGIDNDRSGDLNKEEMTLFFKTHC